MPHVMISNKKCTGCHMCELACSAWHEGAYRPSVARLHVEVNPTTIAVKGSTCLQTGCAKCEQACLENAIERLEIAVHPAGAEADASPIPGWVLKVDEARCTNCGECYAVCPHGVIFEHPERHVAMKCDLCEGNPQCVTFCQNPHVLAVTVRTSKAEKALAVPAAG
jgi:anaerobic carbon-monoxide dehydrogenase iron sulfur subunit